MERILWGAFLVSVLFFGAVLIMATGGFDAIGQLDQDRMLRFGDPLYLAFSVLAMSAFLGHRLAPRWVVAADPERKKTVGFLLQATMLESIAIFGMVLGLMYGDAQVGIPFLFMGLVGLFSINPMLKMDRPEPGGAPLNSYFF